MASDQNNTRSTMEGIIATNHDLGSLELKLSEKIGDTRTEMIKWMFIFWVGQIVATFGFILLFLKK